MLPMPSDQKAHDVNSAGRTTSSRSGKGFCSKQTLSPLVLLESVCDVREKQLN